MTQGFLFALARGCYPRGNQLRLSFYSKGKELNKGKAKDDMAEPGWTMVTRKRKTTNEKGETSKVADEPYMGAVEQDCDVGGREPNRLVRTNLELAGDAEITNKAIEDHGQVGVQQEERGFSSPNKFTTLLERIEEEDEQRAMLFQRCLLWLVNLSPRAVIASKKIPLHLS